MTDSATQQGVQEEGTPALNPRNAVLESIATRTAEQRDDEMRKAGMEPAKTLLEEKKEEETKPAGEEAGAEEEKAKVEAKAEVEEEVETIKVDGQEQKVPKSKIYEAGKRALQKESAADQRLEEATRLFKEAQTLHAKLNTTESPGTASPEKKALNWDDLAEKLQYGNKTDAAEAIQTIVEATGRSHEQVATQTQNLSPEQVDQYVSKAVVERMAFQTAMDRFQQPPDQGGYADLWSEPVLRNLVIQKEAELREKGDTRPYWEVFQEAGNSIREWTKKLAGPTQTGGADFNQKREQKRTITVVEGAGAKATSQKEAPKPETPQDVINRMRQARGQR